MISLSVFIISAIILGFAMGSFNLKNYVIEKPGHYDEFNIKQVIKSVVVLVLAIVISLVQPIEVQRIDAGNIGLKIDRVGNDKGVPVAIPIKGWVFYNSWMSDVVEYSIRQNHIKYNKFSVTTKGGMVTTTV